MKTEEKTVRMHLGILAEDDIEKLPIEHPLRRVARSDETSQVRVNSEQAAKTIKVMNSEWLDQLKHRLIDQTDHTNASSALGEIRAFGSLLETGMDVIPGPKIVESNASPEFEIKNGNSSVIVEVHSRQIDKIQKRAMAENRQALDLKHAADKQMAAADGEKKNVVTIDIQEVFPYGEPAVGKEGDTVATNAISRVASVKGKEHQVDSSKPFVLWLDLQDETVWGGLSVSDDHFSPIYTETKDGVVGPGVFWFALYGRKNDPLPLSKGFDYASMPLAHEGRFNQTVNGKPSCVSAFVFSLPRATILMENPVALKPIPSSFRLAMLKAPFFRLDLSILDWEKGIADQLVSSQRAALVAAVKALKQSNPQ